MKYTSIRGMEDILPSDIRIWQDIEKKARCELKSSGYSEIRTPILEDTAVFARGIGETTDIVSKEMYTFTDRKLRSISLRPEGTAPIVRAYIEHGLHSLSPLQRLYYIGPMFRSERPQKGRSRQFHQIGVEVIGSSSLFADVEVIAQLSGMLNALGLKGFKIKLNSLGCRADKAAFAEEMRSYLADKKDRLCEDCKTRIDKNVLRTLDCKNDTCIAVARLAPNVVDSLCAGCASHFNRLKSSLSSLGIVFEEARNLVRGLDYYTGAVFEITHPALGSQDAIGAGGRYDNLVKDMGGPDVGAVGYALGIERMILAIKDNPVETKGESVVYIATMGDAAKVEGMRLAGQIREAMPGVVVLKDVSETSLKSQMRNADKNGSKVVLIIGEDEVNSQKVTLKMMEDDAPQGLIDRGVIIEELRRRLC